MLQAYPSLGLPSSSLEAADPFTLTSFALALLLAFRLDASYTRFMEGRKIWGDVVCDSRNLMRQVIDVQAHTYGMHAHDSRKTQVLCILFLWPYLQAQGFVEDEESLQLLLRWTSAFSKVLMWHVREHCDLRAELQVTLTLFSRSTPITSLTPTITVSSSSSQAACSSTL